MRRMISLMVVLIAALAGATTAMGAEVLISVNKTIDVDDALLIARQVEI